MAVRPDDKAKRVLMGRIVAAQGLKGEVRINSFCATPLDIAAYGPLLTDRQGLVVEIAAARQAGKSVVARLAGIADRNAAEGLRGVGLYVAREKLPPEDGDDDFYQADLIGLSVRLGDGREVGTVKAVEDFGAGTIIEITLRTGASALYAFTRANFPEVAVSKGYLVLDPPAETEARE